MLYYLFTYLDERFSLMGAGVFQYISFRAAMAFLLSLVISMIFGKHIINFLKRMQIGENVRDLGLEGQLQKKGTPTMGGLIILLAIILPTLLFSKLHNIYIILMLIVTIWFGLIGFIDDYIKVFKKDKAGLAGKFKIIGQVMIAALVGLVLFFHPEVIIRETVSESVYQEKHKNGSNDYTIYQVFERNEKTFYQIDHKSTKTTIPFFKQNELDYSKLLSFLGEGHEKWTFLLFILIVTFIITAVSNGVNLTDGLDGLAAGTSAIVVGILAAFAWISGNAVFATYFNIMFIPNLGEVVIFSGAMVGACIGFLWYNSYPAQVFMGDTGSIALGGLIAVLAIMVKKELLLPILCGIFLMESLSVIIQVAYFKYTRKKYGEGKRLFKMAPLHHHYQKMNMHESKIVARFWIVGVLLAIITIVTLKLR